MSGINAEYPDSESPDPFICFLFRDEPDNEEDEEEDDGDSKEDGDDDVGDDGYSE
jgi:hypothetical protein